MKDTSSTQPTLPPENMTFITGNPQQQDQQVQSAQQPQTGPEEQGNYVLPTQGADEPVPASVSATIKTSKGDIQLVLYGDVAPNTVRNFMKKAQTNYYNNLTFHRVEDWVIQGGDPKGDGTGGGNMPVEFNNKPFKVGSLGVASRGDGVNQNDSQFFITKQDASWLNGKYTNFGEVTEGMDVVNKIQIGDKILSINIQ